MCLDQLATHHANSMLPCWYILTLLNLRLLLQEEQQKMSASKAVIPEDQREAQEAGNKQTVVSKDGDTIYLGFDKG